MKLEKPKILIGDTKKELITTCGVASEILKFSNRRKDIPVENYLQEHIKILAIAFDTSEEEIKNNVPFAVVVQKYFESLEYVARVIQGIADDGDEETETEPTAAGVAV